MICYLICLLLYCVLLKMVFFGAWVNKTGIGAIVIVIITIVVPYAFVECLHYVFRSRYVVVVSYDVIVCMRTYLMHKL